MPVYVPIITDPTVKLFCHDKSVHIAAGEAVTFDNTQCHWRINGQDQECIYLVVETKGSPTFNKMRGHGGENIPVRDIPFRDIPFVPENHCQIPLEVYRFEVLTTQEISDLSRNILFEIENAQIPQSEFQNVVHHVEAFRQQWEKTFSRFGHHHAGELAYQDSILYFHEQIVPLTRKWLHLGGKGKNAQMVISSMLLMSPPAPKRINRRLLAKKRLLQTEPEQNWEDFQCPEFEKPLFIVSTPRAGSTLLFETLSQFPEVWTIGEESHELIEGIPALHPSAKNYSSNRLTEADALPDISSALRERFARQLQDREGGAYFKLSVKQRPKKVRFIEKTPKNALRIPFIKAVFPDALFIYLYRDPKENISSMMEGWRSRRFIAYRDMPGWPFKEWSFLLTPGWASLQDKPLVEIAAYQWKTTNAYILDDLRALPPSSWYQVRYSDLIQTPKKIISEMSQFAGLHWDQHIEQKLSQSLPVSQMTLSAPSPDKWRKNEKDIATVLPALGMCMK
jgi:hypothetical protein